MIQVVIKSGMVWEVLCSESPEKLINIEVVDMDNPSLETIIPCLFEKRMDENRKKVGEEIKKNQKIERENEEYNEKLKKN